ncbi:hypothetical protein, unknown function [Leishmania tarentolae]|uniref:Uncharacterized protein n=1 Tax=Leishmania tarentolae TaxID=5689 RepID=A0A640KXU8_LEITA|nr:hypothetical protein, unknown function [Leishmania tarentolae]
MSRLTSAACPLSDCTLAVDNAENIRNSKDAVLLGLKVSTAATVIPSTPRQRALLRTVKAVSRSAAADTITPSASLDRVSGFAHYEHVAASLTAANTAAVMPPSCACAAYCSSSLDNHVLAKSFTSASPHRNDPYSPCLLKSSCTPEDSFFACYSDVDETPAVVAMNPANTPIRSHVVCQKSALPTETQALLKLLSKATTSLSPFMSPMRTPLKTTDSMEHSPASFTAVGGLTTAPSLASTPERAASPSSRQLPTTSARVIRKVVSCGVDRTSGRPVPKPKD